MQGRTGRNFVLSVAIAFVATACAWGQAGGNAARNGANPFEPGLTPANVSSLALDWQSYASGGDPVMNAKYVFTSDFGFVNAYAANGPASPAGARQCSGTPVVCRPAWFSRVVINGVTGDPAVEGNHLFVSGAVNGHWSLFAINADPVDCPDTAIGCEPSWTGQWGVPDRPQSTPQIAIAGGHVYVATPADMDSDLAHVTVFDERGITNSAAGPPRTCSPLLDFETTTTWQIPPAIAVAAGRLFVETTNATLVFDAAGQAGCAAGTCTALYRLATGAARGVSVYGATAYAATGSSLMAFDATGATGCSGTPVVCQPRWAAALRGPATSDLPTVSSDTVLVMESPDAPTDPGVEAFDASGDTGCGGTPKLCTSLWAISRGGMAGDVNHLAATPTLLIMSGWSVIPFNPPIVRQTLKTFDLSGTQGCDGAPRVCYALSTTEIGTDIGIGYPAVAFGRIAVGGAPGHTKTYAIPGA